MKYLHLYWLDGKFEVLDLLDRETVGECFKRHGIGQGALRALDSFLPAESDKAVMKWVNSAWQKSKARRFIDFKLYYGKGDYSTFMPNLSVSSINLTERGTEYVFDDNTLFWTDADDNVTVEDSAFLN